MKKTYIMFFLACLLFFCPTIYGFEQFIPSSSNPLIVTSEYDNWIELGISQPNIIFDNGTYRMWYTSVGNGIRIAYAESTDGLVWHGKRLYDFFNGQDTHDPSILKTTDKYILFFANTPPNEHTKVWQINSTDGINFDNSTLKSTLEPDVTWETNGISSPVIYSENNNNYLFYTGLNTKWNMGLAISTDGSAFLKCNTNPFLEGDVVPKSIIKSGDEFFLFFHSANGIEYIKTSNLSCNSQWSQRTALSISGFFPFVHQAPNQFMLYYSTISATGWRLNLALSPIISPTLTPTIEPTPTIPFPSPILPTPTPNIDKRPIIIIPGLFASWNKKAILYNQQVHQSNWEINPVIQEYDGIIKTLQNCGYKENTDLFMFYYDWRKNINESSQELKSFIDGKRLKKTPDIIGHSLGGLIGKIYIDRYGTNSLHKLITVGSPYKGVAQVYKFYEAGEIEEGNIIFNLTQQLILQLYRDGIQTNRQIAVKNLPVMQNLFPIYNFLKQKNTFIPISSMQIKNNLLIKNQTLHENTFTIVGKKGETTSGYIITERTLLDKLLDRYPDGRPEHTLSSPGDYTVTVNSAALGKHISTLFKDHGELIYSKEAIEHILQTLKINYLEKDITEGKKTILTPSLIFIVLSPASIEVKKNNRTYQEKKGIVFIKNAESGPYTIHVKGHETGAYKILIGQLGTSRTIWQQVDGWITHIGQLEKYSLVFDAEKPIEQPVDILDNLIIFLKKLNTSVNDAYIGQVINNLEKSGTGKQLGTKLFVVHNKLIQSIEKQSDSQIRAKLFTALSKIELLLSNNEYRSHENQSYTLLNLQYYKLKLLFEIKQKNLIYAKNSKYNKTYIIQLIMTIEEKLNKTKIALKDKNYLYARILLLSAEKLLSHVK
ncbi:MAG: hypothetical protein WC489_04725 [Patescibacteria group bacterium]